MAECCFQITLPLRNMVECRQRLFPATVRAGAVSSLALMRSFRVENCNKIVRARAPVCLAS